MPLTVLSADAAFGAEDLLRQAWQVELRWSEHLADQRLIDQGRLFASSALSTVADANCLLDPAASAANLEDDLAKVDAAFAEAGARCLRWAFPSNAAEALWSEPLRTRGFNPVTARLFRLRHTLPGSSALSHTLKIIPARAALGGYARFVERSHGGPAGAPAQAAQAALLHLDDGHYDVLVAMSAGEVIGSVGVFSLGQVGAIRELRVCATHRRRGIGRLMLERAVDSCARSLFRHVLASVDPPGEEEEAAERLLHDTGFVDVGALLRMERL